MTEKEKLIGKDGTVYAVDRGFLYLPPKFPRNTEARARLQELFASGEAEGMTQREIAKRLGVSQASVYQWMKEAGISYRRPRRPGPAQKRLQEFFDSGEAEGLTQREIAERIGLSPSQVSYLMKRTGLSRRLGAQTRLQKLLDSGEAEGMTQGEIAERIGASRARVSQLMKEGGISYRRPRRAQKRLQEFFDSGEAEGLTQKEIAERVGVSPTRASQLIKEMGVPYQRPRRTQKRLQKLLDSGEAEGLTQKEIAKRLGVSPGTVSLLLKNMGISRRPRLPGTAQTRLQKLLDSGEAEGMTRREVAERIGVSPGHVSLLLKNMGISHRPFKAGRQRDPEIRERLQRLFDSGEAEKMTQREIAERVGASRASVYQWMKEAGISYRRPRRPGPTQKRLQKLLDSGEAEGLTQKEIGERIGVGQVRVSYLMKRMGLSRRRKGRR
jgi:DNA-directed RNA polymerase specialized sigma subunit